MTIVSSEYENNDLNNENNDDSLEFGPHEKGKF